MSESPFLSIVVPVCNEENSVQKNIHVIYSHAQVAHEDCEVVVVDDGSKDNSWNILKELAQKNGNIKCVRFSRNFGKESAIRAGLLHAKGQVTIVIDSDLQHPPDLMPKMLELWTQGHNVISALKKTRGRESLSKRIGARLFYKLFKMLTGKDLRNQSDYKLLDRTVVAEYLKLPENITFFRGLIPWLGYKEAKIYFEVNERAVGTSKWSSLKLFKYSAAAITSFSSIPLHIVTCIGTLFFIFAFLLGAHTLYMKISGHAVSGFTTVIILQLIIGSGLMLSLGIIGKYIEHIFTEVKNRPNFIVTEKINIDVP